MAGGRREKQRMAGAKDSLVVMEILVVAAATLVVHTLAATTYHVGDTFGWQVPSGGYNYSNWATQHTFVAGDSLGKFFWPI